MRLLKPKDRIVFTLADDAHMPEDQRPKLVGKVLSVADAQKMMAMAENSPDRSAVIDKVLDAAMVGLSGWENVCYPETNDPIPFSRDSLAEWLTIEELTEIVDFLAGRLTVDERKKSELPLSSNAENSANPAKDSVETT